MQNLVRRRVALKGNCPRSSTKEESLLHVIRDCNNVREVWHILGFKWDKEIYSALPLAEWFDKVVDNFSQDRFETFLIAAWVIWSGRNEEFYGGKKLSAAQTATFVRSYREEFMNAQEKRDMGVQGGLVIWRPPPSSSAKVNFDGSYNRDTGEGGIGLVVRDVDGTVLGTLSMKRIEIAYPWMIEGKVALEVLKFARDLGLARILLERDALESILEKEGIKQPMPWPNMD
ncbi:uncharacterized protein LOC111274267 [Durio zibethinus]|uniref:Uncharacterized protein LOC111274267 n=1 Tax=Durio zibethinus TaxID=66656 RepID=A0A6P5WFF7_DURZI|nr:uncharacterized protein LOC111274267 [Durio zibethinus]